MMNLTHLAQRLVARQDDACIQTCLQSAAATASCTTEACICASTTFHSAALTCLNASCGGGTGIDFSSALNSVLSACETGGLDGLASLSESFSSVYNSLTRTSLPTSTRSSGSSGSGLGGSSADNSGTGGDNGGSKTNIAAIAGGIVGGLVLLALIAGLIFFLVRRSRRRGTPPVQSLPYTAPTPGSDEHKDGPQAVPLMSGYAANSGYANSTTYATPSMYSGPTSASTAPSSDLGYVPPQQFAMYTTNPSHTPSPAAAPAPQPAYSHPGGFVVPQQPPAQSQQFDPYGQYDASAAPRMSTYSNATSSQTQWPGDTKRPLTVMSAESSGAGGSGGRDEAPPIYRQ